MTTQETENANPFKDFVTDSFVDAVPETPTAPVGGEANAGAGAESGSVPAAENAPTVSGAEADGGAEGEGTPPAEGEAPKEGEPPEGEKKPVVKKTAAERSQEIQRRIANETRELRDLERRKAALQSELSDSKPPLTPQAKPAKPVDEGRPKPADYTYGELDGDYIADLATHVADKRIAAATAENIRLRDAETASRAQAALETTKTAVFEKAAAKFADFQEVVLDSIAADEWNLSKTLGDLVLASPVAPELLYHLATHQDEANKVFKKSPAEQGAYFGRLEAQLTKPAAKAAPEAKAPKIPAPVTQPRGAGGKFETSPDTEDFSAFEAMANKTA